MRKFKNISTKKLRLMIISILVVIPLALLAFSIAIPKEKSILVGEQSEQISTPSSEIKGEVAGAQEERESDSTIVTKKTTSSPTSTPAPTANPTNSPAQTSAPVTNNTNNYYQAPTTAPVATTAPVDYSEALKQAQEESDRIHAEYQACMDEKNSLIQPLIAQRHQKQAQYDQNMDQCVNAVPGKESQRYITCYENYSNSREEINSIQSQINSISDQYGCY